MDNTLIGFALSLFIAIVVMLALGYQWWMRRHSAAARRFDRRLRAVSEASWQEDGNGAGSIVKDRAFSRSPFVAALLERMPRIHALDRMLMQSGLRWNVSTFTTITFLPPVALWLLGRLLGVPDLMLTVACLGWLVLPFWHVQRRRARRLARIEMQLPEAADMISRALRAGHSFSSALDMAGAELSDPLGAEFRTTFDEINYGASMHDALTNLAERAPLPDLRYLVIAVLIQRESGGNLAEILGNVAYIIRERMKLMGQVRVLSAEGRLSGIILALLPFGLAGAMYLVNPGFLKPLRNDPAGPWIVGYALLLMALGLVWMRRIVRIHI
ncbi:MULTISPECIES: type II secretion system F family protein [Cupriavidus]|uniref:Type II secretion system F family protein n=1 Tax=Cupriavidus pauculus TaxID=82633 RepID=A0A5P2GZ27_9BURK|nr:type II secretion system F family protein [Cupriavidus pauculus]QET00841.1 type II secretion system F family protein [Cupriavidus pauculus]